MLRRKCEREIFKREASKNLTVGFIMKAFFNFRTSTDSRLAFCKKCSEVQVTNLSKMATSGFKKNLSKTMVCSARSYLFKVTH